MNPLRLLLSNNQSAANDRFQPRLSCWRFAAQLLLVFACLGGLATAYTAVNYTYSTSLDDTATITAYTGRGGAVVIPAELGGYPVTAIGDSAFEFKSTITSVTIPNSVTSIGDYAFRGCSLTSVTIPDSVTSIGNLAFTWTALTNVTIPASVTSIGECAFQCYTTSITVDPSNGSYSSSEGVLFNKARTALIQYPLVRTGNYTIPDGVTRIENNSFYGYNCLTNVTIPASVTSIGAAAFFGYSLSHIIFKGNPPALGSHAFSSGTVTYPSTATGWGATFGGLPTVADQSNWWTYTTANNQVTITGYFDTGGAVVIPATFGGVTVTAINDWAFSNFKSLTRVAIPSSVTRIGANAFKGCSGLTSLTIPDSVTSIGASVFQDCSGLTSVAIGSSVTSIGASAFSGCSGLTSVAIPNSVTSIESGAFAGCGGLTSVTIPNVSTFTSLFPDRSLLTSVTFAEGVTAIGDNMLSGMSTVTSVTFPVSVTYIGNSAFQNCSGLTNLAFKANAPTLGTNPFAGMTATVTYPSLVMGWGASFGGLSTVADDSMLNYTTANNQVTITSYLGTGGAIVIPASIGGVTVTAIGAGAFANCSGLLNAQIPGDVTLETSSFPMGTTIVRYFSDVQLAGRDSQQNAAGRTAGQADVTNAPVNYGLYNLSQVQALNVGAPLLTRDAVSKKFKLTVKAKKSTDLVNFSDLPFVSGDSTINSNGEMEFQFASPDNAAFFRIESH